jgi:3-dehydroquinate dehydratase I
MHTLKQLLRQDIPLVAVGFADKTPQNVIKDGIKFGLDVAELRIDLYSSFEQQYVLKEVRKYSGLPTVATIRIKAEGGKWSLSEKERLNLFKAIINDVSSVDVELAAKGISREVVKLAHSAGKLVFVSYHDFTKTPSLDVLNKVVKDAKSLGADVVKVATSASSTKDLQTLAKFTIENANKDLVTIAMGSEGLVSRLFFPALGSRLTYAYIGQPTAPGQLSFTETFYLLRKLYPEYNQQKINSMGLVEAI